MHAQTQPYTFMCNSNSSNFILSWKTWEVVAQSPELEARVKNARLKKKHWKDKNIPKIDLELNKVYS